MKKVFYLFAVCLMAGMTMSMVSCGGDDESSNGGTGTPAVTPEQENISAFKKILIKENWMGVSDGSSLSATKDSLHYSCTYGSGNNIQTESGTYAYTISRYDPTTGEGSFVLNGRTIGLSGNWVELVNRSAPFTYKNDTLTFFNHKMVTYTKWLEGIINR